MLWASEDWLTFCGFTNDEIVGRSLKILHGDATDLDTAEAINFAALSGEEISATLINYTKCGWSFEHTVHVEPLLNASRDSVAVFKVTSHNVVSSRDFQPCRHHDSHSLQKPPFVQRTPPTSSAGLLTADATNSARHEPDLAEQKGCTDMLRRLLKESPEEHGSAS